MTDPRPPIEADYDIYSTDEGDLPDAEYDVYAEQGADDFYGKGI
jgi:hypothetical protein